jgi:hypothetical protein
MERSGGGVCCVLEARREDRLRFYGLDAGGGLTAGAYARWNVLASRLVGEGGKHCQVCSSEAHHRALQRWMLSGHTWLQPYACSKLIISSQAHPPRRGAM